MNWKQAFSLGLLAPGEWGGRGEPVAYQYNGVRLPDIETVWTDKTKYPYATIQSNPNTGEVMLYVSSQVPVVESSGCKVKSGCMFISYKLLDGIWTSWTANTVTSWYSFYPATWLIWSNEDILHYSDNSVYMAGSDPIPVYG